MQISLKNNIVILDEAHNIENNARDSASWEVNQDQVREAMQDLEKMGKFYTEVGGADPQPYFALAKLASKLSNWIDEAKKDTMVGGECKVFDEFRATSYVWNGTQAVAKFMIQGFGPEDTRRYKEDFVKVQRDKDMAMAEEDENRGNEKKSPVLNSNTEGVLEGFLMTLDYLYEQDHKFRDDFRVALVKKQEQKQTISSKNWLGKHIQNSVKLEYVYKAHFWCMNPAVVFDVMKNECRSIVLTSGTLSPMTSFSSELNVEFPVQLEANHVIDKNQVWIGTVSRGPRGNELKCVYEQTESLQFQVRFRHTAFTFVIFQFEHHVVFTIVF